MAEDKPGWYYVGNGQLRYMDGDGWTEEYKPAGRAGSGADAGKSDLEPAAGSCEVLESATDGLTRTEPPTRTELPARGGHRAKRSLTMLVVAVALQLIAGLIHLMVAIWRLVVALSRVIVGRFRGKPVGTSNESAVRQQLSLACQFAPPPADPEETTICQRCGTSVGVVARVCAVCVLP
jgi:hypothetical protein